MNPIMEASNQMYAGSVIGYVHLTALVCSLLAFICNISVPTCRGHMTCAPTAFTLTYTYFSAVTCITFVSTSLFYVLHCSKVYHILPFALKNKLFTELLYLGMVLFFLIIGNILMIHRNGNRLNFMASTIFGCSSMSALGIQLMMVFIRFRLIFRLSEESHVKSAEIM